MAKRSGDSTPVKSKRQTIQGSGKRSLLRDWTTDEAISALRECAGKLGCRLAYSDTSLPVLMQTEYQNWGRDRDVPDLPAIHRLFPFGWRGACLAADLGPINGPGPRVSLLQVNRALKQLADRLPGQGIALGDLDRLQGSERISARDVRYYWGTWQNACDANGLTARKPLYNELADDQALMDALDELLPATVRPFNAIRPAEMPSAQTLARHLADGSWIELQSQRGISADAIEAERVRSNREAQQIKAAKRAEQARLEKEKASGSPASVEAATPDK